MTHDEMIAVIQAHKAGEQIEARALGTTLESEWHTPHLSQPSWDFNRFSYRVKPLLREWWMVGNGTTPMRAYGTREVAARAGFGAGYGGRDIAPVHVREVLPEPSP